MLTKESVLTYRVPYADTDQAAVVYYGNYLAYFERGRSSVLRDMGYPYSNFEKLGYRLPVIEAHVDYKSFDCYEDELDLHGYFEVTDKLRLKAHHEIRRGDTLIASGYTIHLCFSIERQKPARFPDAFYTKLEDYCNA